MSKDMPWSRLQVIDVSQSLPTDKLGQALATIKAWRVEPDAVVICPLCAAGGLEIVDQSARPYAEWYVMRCASCGLDQVVQVPLAPPAT